MVPLLLNVFLDIFISTFVFSLKADSTTTVFFLTLSHCLF